MAKRFVATELWDEDWFLEMPNEYKLFWYYMLSACNHAGLYKLNLRSFCGLNEVKVDPNTILEFFNSGKNRIRVINPTLWLIEDFFAFQYGHTFNKNNRVHQSIENELIKYNIELTSIRGLIEVVDRVKDKDKEKDKDIVLKGGVGENIIGEYFDEAKDHVVFTDGSKLKLGTNQKCDAEHGRLSPKSMRKGMRSF